ncbi:MAG: phenylacetic acid degradation protein PaaN [Phycisphaerales bacterium]|nr:phenylacetic acid degradation protein PaaN [Phycisphaerales bacterium]
MSHPLFDRHRKTLESATAAIRNRTYWSAYPEVPSGKIYGETAKQDGLAAFKARLGQPFELDQPGSIGRVGDEASPFGLSLGVNYPKADPDALLHAAGAALPDWRDAGIEARTGICLEILHRLNQRSFEIANAVMHTTGQAFMMAFQAGGPHAQDRGLEALAYAYEEMSRTPEQVTWQKQVGKEEFVTLNKKFRLIPRGIGLVIGCSTFPTWNGYPGIFASLATGNAVVVKPHPGAILPLAITVEIAREVLKENDLDPNLVTLVADTVDAPITKDLVIRPEIKIIDYTGGSAFGDWIENNARQAVVFTEKAGVNSMILDSVDNLKPVSGNLAFSLSLYSGQMCTTPQNIFIPKDGIRVGGEQKSFDEVAQAIVGAVDWFLGDAKRAAEVLGGIQNEATTGRIAQAAAQGGRVLRQSEPVRNEAFPEARVHSPLILQVESGQKDLYMREMFGPIVYIVATENTEQSIKLAAQTAREHGAITCGIYSTDEDVLAAAEEAISDAGVPLSCNLTGQIFVNQSAAFSDFHVSGANPAGNATLCDAAFVANRFRVVQSRAPVTVEASSTA